MAKSYDVAVIGGGHNGLVAAAYLARAGLSVAVFERRQSAGGTVATRRTADGYIMFSGPHLLTGFNPAVIRDLNLVKYGLEIMSVPGRTTVIDPGHAVSLLPERTDTISEIRKFSRNDASVYISFMRRLEQQIRMIRALQTLGIGAEDGERITARERFDRQIKALSEFGEDAIYHLANFWTSSAKHYLDGFFESEAVKAHLAVPGFIGIAKGPMTSATAYTLIRQHWPELSGGIHGAVKGGMGRLTDSLLNAAQAAGCEIHYGAQVVEITARRNRVNGFVLQDGSVIRVQKVISNLDYKTTILTLFDWHSLPSRLVRSARNYRMKGSLAKLNLKLSGLPSVPALGGRNTLLGGPLHFAGDMMGLERAYDDWEQQAFPKQPFIEAFIPSALDPSLAPDGGQIMSVYLQYVPKTLLSGEWDGQDRADLAGAAIDQLANYSPDLKDLVVDWEITLPADFEQEFFLTNGDVYHGDAPLDRVMFPAPPFPVQDMKAAVGGLYFCGAGPDLSGGLSGDGGRAAARRVLIDLNRNHRTHAAG